MNIVQNPDLYNFGDSNPESFGSVAYAVFDMESGSKKSNLLMLKAKLGLIVQIGQTFWEKIESAIYIVNFKDWLVK